MDVVTKLKEQPKDLDLAVAFRNIISPLHTHDQRENGIISNTYH
jgi:hypothetical protein